MPFFKALTIVHYSSSLILTIIISILWDISFANKFNIKISHICSPFVGCSVNNFEQKLCKSGQLVCTGSNRCCNDCRSLQKQKEVLSEGNRTKLITLNDTFAYPIDICAIGATFIFILHISLLIFLKYYHSYSNRKDKSKHCQYIIKFVIFVNFIVIFFCSLGLVLYNISYVLSHLHLLIRCQPSFILLLSWLWIHLLWIFEFILDTVPYTSEKYLIKTYQSAHATHLKILRLCIYPLMLFVKVLNITTLVWWVSVPVYLIGVSYNMWQI